MSATLTVKINESQPVPNEVMFALLRREGKYTNMVTVFHCIEIFKDHWIGVAGDGDNGSYEFFFPSPWRFLLFRRGVWRHRRCVARCFGEGGAVNITGYISKAKPRGRWDDPAVHIAVDGKPFCGLAHGPFQTDIGPATCLHCQAKARRMSADTEIIKRHE